MKLIFIGPPGAGKGTQAARVAAAFGIAHISTGDMLRAEIREGTELGLAAQALIERGELVSDDVILAMVQNRITMADCKNGFLFDGFPRTIAQAEALKSFCTVDRVIDIDVPAERLIERIAGRRMCPACGAAYHVSLYPSETCVCGGALYQREDDKEETVRNRLAVYERSTRPLIRFYESEGLLEKVDGDRTVDEVTDAIMTVLQK